MAERALLIVGRIIAPHGIRGEVKIKSFTDDPASLADYTPLLLGNGPQQVEITTFKPYKIGFLARLKGIDDRTAAETVCGQDLKIDRAQLPQVDTGTFYHSDLIGLAVRDRLEVTIGKVIGMQNYGAGDLIEIEITGQGATVLLPFTEACVPHIDTMAGYISIDPPAGLVETGLTESE